jgi:4-hydroxy-3-methylbut-2-enyl diphosphate reductase IspH
MVRNSANTNPHRRAEKVQMSATTLRVAPIRTCPAPAAEQICHECLSRWQALDGLGLGLDFSFVVVGDPSSSNAVEFKDLIVKKYPKASVVLALDEKGLEAEISQISFRGDVFLVSATSASDQDVQKIYKKLKSAEKIYKLKHPFLGR